MGVIKPKAGGRIKILKIFMDSLMFWQELI